MNKVGNRLGFIDASRSLAILLMLHGHFFSAAFQDYSVYSAAFKADGSSGNILFDLRYLLSGMTAPLFFTITGFVFVYLLLREKQIALKEQPRLRKGIKRATLLIAIGYIIQLNFKNIGLYARGELNSAFYNFHVLQSIGMSMLIIIVLYALFRKAKYFNMPRILFGLGFLVFTLTPFIKEHSTFWYSESLHPVLVNVIRGDFGNFSLFPWLGYVLLGGGLGSILQRNPQIIEQGKVAIRVYLVGIISISVLVTLLFSLYMIFPTTYFDTVAVRLTRFGVIFSTIAILYTLEKRRMLQIPFLVEMGKETLSLYIIHAIVLYGSVIGIGLKSFIGGSLSLTSSMIGALIFILILGIYVRYKPMMYTWMNRGIRKLRYALTLL